MADLLDIRSRLDALHGYLDLDAKAREREELEMMSSQPGFWDKAEAAQATLKKMNMLKGWIDSWESLSQRQKDIVELSEMAAMENDTDLVAQLEKDGEQLEADLRKFELKKMLDKVLDGLLTEREAKVLRMYYGINYSKEFTFDEIGRELRLTRERVRQIKNKSLNKLLKNKNSSDILFPFLSGGPQD